MCKCSEIRVGFLTEGPFRHFHIDNSEYNSEYVPQKTFWNYFFVANTSRDYLEWDGQGWEENGGFFALLNKE